MVFIFSWVYNKEPAGATASTSLFKSPKRTSSLHRTCARVPHRHRPRTSPPRPHPPAQRKSAHTPLSFSISYRLFVSLSRRLGSLADSRTVALPFSHTHEPRNTSRPIEPLLSSRAQSQASAQLVVLWPQRAFARPQDTLPVACSQLAAHSRTHAHTHSHSHTY